MYNYEYRTPKPSTQTKLYRGLRLQTKYVLEGRGLILDPSIGSLSSQPGYAIYEAGVLVDSGVIDMPSAATIYRRLYYLGKCLREQFPEKFDYVVIEDIPPFRFGRSGHASIQRQLPLHYAAAVCMSSFDAPLIVEVAVGTWRSYAGELHLHEKEQGARTDEQDAICMGHAVVEIARHAAENPTKRGRPKKVLRRRRSK